MAKATAERSSAINIFWLKKNGFLDKNFSYNSGNIRWKRGINDIDCSVGFSINRDNWGTSSEKTYMKLQYTHTDSFSGQKNEMDYNISLVTTPCNYGGKRYWFVCPLCKKEYCCRRRVGVLYSIGKWFGCRHCGKIAYQSQFEGGKYRIGSTTELDVKNAYYEIKRTHYNGKPTRKYKRYLRLRNKVHNSWLIIAAKIGMKL